MTLDDHTNVGTFWFDRANVAIKRRSCSEVICLFPFRFNLYDRFEHSVSVER